MAKHMVLRLAACCLSAATALAWPQTTPEKSSASLEGKILNQTNDNPLKKTSLLLRAVGGGKSLSSESDDKGVFSFPTVEPGQYTLTGERAGFAEQAYGARGKSSTGSVFTLRAGQEIKDLVFKLSPNAVIAGKVLDEDGDPLSPSIVVALRPGYLRGRKQLTEAGSSITGANGEYSISVTGGRYLLAAVSMASMAAGAEGAK
jgi:hypothetical protein